MIQKVFMTASVLLLSTGCFLQSKSAALKHVCNIPETLQSDATKVGPYVARKVHNREVRDLLAHMDDPNDIKGYMIKNGVDPDTCDLIVMFKEKPEPEQKTTEPQREQPVNTNAP